MTDIRGSVVLVTGGQRGLGAALVAELLTHEPAKIYVTARAPQPAGDSRVRPLRLALGDAASTRELARDAQDVSIVINNAGELGSGGVLTANIDSMRAFLDTNLFGTIAVSQAFAPILARNGGGALVNILSVMSWMSGGGAYGLSKAALWNATNSMRDELAPAGTLVTGVHIGYIDTELVSHLQQPKARPQDVARIIVDGIRANQEEILADPIAVATKAALSGPVKYLAIPSDKALH